jgi:hypothetical protein
MPHTAIRTPFDAAPSVAHLPRSRMNRADVLGGWKSPCFDMYMSKQLSSHAQGPPGSFQRKNNDRSRERVTTAYLCGSTAPAPLGRGWERPDSPPFITCLLPYACRIPLFLRCAGHTGRRERMREPHSEGVANHADPESCGDVREDGAEALTGAHAGQVLSRENNHFEVPTLLQKAEGHTGRIVSARPVWTSRGRRPCARMEPF